MHPRGHLHLLFLTQNNFTDNACCILIHRALPTSAPLALIRRPLAAKRKLAARASKQQDATGKQLVSGTGGLLYHLMLFLYHALQQCCGACKVDWHAMPWRPFHIPILLAVHNIQQHFVPHTVLEPVPRNLLSLAEAYIVCDTALQVGFVVASLLCNH